MILKIIEQEKNCALGGAQKRWWNPAGQPSILTSIVDITRESEGLYVDFDCMELLLKLISDF